MSILISSQIDKYLAYKRSLGYQLRSEETTFNNFRSYLVENEYEGSLTKNIVFDWISSGSNNDKTASRKLEVIRPFSKFACSIDDKAEIMPTKFYRNTRERPVPYIYSEAEVLQLMSKCDDLFSPDNIRRETIKTIIGLLWSTGMRPGEPLNLKVKDISFKNNTIFISQTKFTKDRLIPIKPSVSQALLQYHKWVSKLIGPMSDEDSFFVTTYGKPLTQAGLCYAFTLIRDDIDASPIGYKYVRLYDFRHTMACNVIKRWHLKNININDNLFYLSSYLGHVKPQDTYWYLSATPETMKICSDNYEEMYGDLDE